MPNAQLRQQFGRLQQELADLKIRYMAGPADDPARNERFAQEEAELGARFRAIGESPSYPAGFLRESPAAADWQTTATAQDRWDE